MLLPIRYIACLFTAAGAFLQVVAQEAPTTDTLTLERSTALALEFNRNVQQSHIRARGAAINLRQAKQNLLPSLDAGMSHSYSQGRFINPTTNQYVEENFVSGNQHVSSSLILFDGLRMFRNITLQAHAYRATQLEEQLMEEQVALDVTAAYINVLTAKDMVAQIDSQVAVTQRQVERSTVLFDEGAIAPGDYYDLKGQYASDLNSLNTAENTLSENLLSLFRLMNLPYDEGVSFMPLQALPLPKAPVADADVLYQTASERLGIIKAVDHWQQQAEFSLKAARSSYFPTLSLGAGLSSNYSKDGMGSYYDQVQNNLGRSLAFSLSIPIFSRFQVRNNVARAKLDVLNAEQSAQTRRNELQQTTHQVLFNLEAAKERYKNLVEQVAHYKESFRIAEVRFNAGAINSVEFLIAKNKMDNANANLVIACYQWHLRQRIVDYYNGELLVGEVE
ncbi:TolC family protein [Parapedobacter sp. 10938]|uniref:TolC family protein n=1 Tax=Parapedobacter flavus TaxID=3110225 RepID=UPI002DB67DC4|nr:TolC family protein [Parapedobacter sp. 10938]MEC3880710.1 TolC family protein [Parapedobacter sp. 10938]